MRTELFDFDLPSDRIALRPISPRDAARLLVVRPGAPAEIEDRVLCDLPDLLRRGDALVLNDTKVIPAQLRGRRIGRGVEVEVGATLVRRLDGARWGALARPGKRLQAGDGLRFAVKADDTSGHVMHPEWGEVSAETAEALNAVRRDGGRIVAVGSTALRLIESAADKDGVLRPFSGETALFITPGYRFRAVDALMTNFHLPRSTLFMLVSAFAGLDTMQRAYAHAIASGYRFYSYGDACLLFRA